MTQAEEVVVIVLMVFLWEPVRFTLKTAMAILHSFILTCPMFVIFFGNVRAVSEQHPHRLQVSKWDGQVQRGPAPGIHLFNVTLKGV